MGGDNLLNDFSRLHFGCAVHLTSTMTPTLVAVIVAWGLLSLYFAIRSREFRKFLAGAFFVSAGIQFYFYLVNLSIPLLGTSFVQTPRISEFRSIIHFMLFLICVYFGFIRKTNVIKTQASSNN